MSSLQHRLSCCALRARWATRPLFAALLACGCAEVYGVDGPYGLAAAGGDGGGGSQDGGSSGGGGGSGSIAASGGESSSGGATGGSPPDAGSGGDTDSGPECPAGHYEGSFNGSHRPLVTVVGVPGTVKAGTISFDLTGSGKTLTVRSGKLEATLGAGPVLPDAGTLTATLTGEFDCASRTIIDGELQGRLEILNVVPASMGGKWEGTLDAAGAFSGTWTESELDPPPDAGAGGAPQPGACVPGQVAGTQPTGTGCGTWDATLAGN